MWKLLYKNNVKIIFKNNEFITMDISLINDKVNINSNVLLSIMTKLFVNDINNEEELISIDKSDYKEYLLFLKRSEEYYQSNLNYPKLLIEEGFENRKIISYLMNYINCMISNFKGKHIDFNEFNNILKKDFLNKINNDFDIPLIYLINYLYKTLLSIYISKEEYYFEESIIRDIGEFTESQLDILEKSSGSIGSIEKFIKDKQNEFDKHLLVRKKKFNDYLNGLSIID